MANFEDFKQRAEEAAGFLFGKSVELGRLAAEKTREYTQTAKLNASILMDKDSLRKEYTELGKLFYEGADEETLAQSCEKIREIIEEIEETQAILNSLREEKKAPDEEWEVIWDDIAEEEEAEKASEEEAVQAEEASEAEEEMFEDMEEASAEDFADEQPEYKEKTEKEELIENLKKAFEEKKE